MVIHQFNKLIRNKWIWGAFAVAISAFFAFDFLLDDLNRSGDERASGGAAGTLAGEAVDAALFTDIAEEIRGFGAQRDWKRKSYEVNRQAWEMYAALEIAEKAGVTASDAEVQEMIRNDKSFQANGAFSFKLYRALLRENSLTPERFEAYLKRRVTLMRLAQAAIGSAAWVSPMEVDRAVQDMTDEFTVRIATFTQDKKDADAVKLDDAGLRKWYDDNTNSLALPERMKIRYVKYDATAEAIQKKMVVTEDEMRDHYDATIDRYTQQDTNGVDVVAKFEDVKPQVEQELRQIAAVQCFETNLNVRAYSVKAAAGASRLDEIAKEDGLKVETSDWFSTEGGYRDGFMRDPSSILPGVKNLADSVAELDSESDDLRYAVVSGEDAVYLVEKAETSPAHVPTFEEAKEVIRPRALGAAKADAFKAQVEAIAKGGAQAVLATKDVSTNVTFSVSEMKDNLFPNQQRVAHAAMKLAKGEVSEFTLVRPGKAVLVVCEDRRQGDAAKAMILRTQMRDQLQSIQARTLPEAWQKWNLDRLGFEAGEINSTEKVEETEE